MTIESNWPALIEAAKAENAKGIAVRGGKKYTSVAVRNEIARRYLGDSIGTETEIVQWSPERGSHIVVRAIIRNTVTGAILATGTAEEIRGQGNVNQTSALENAETSAIGRALASLGLNGGEFASANEMDAVERKKAAQHQPIEDQRQAFRDSIAAETPVKAEGVTNGAHDVTDHDPETGEVHSSGQRSVNAAASGLRDAWIDGIRDSLPDGYTPIEFQEAVAEALIAAFNKLKSEKGVAAQWDKRDGLIMEMQVAHPPAYHRVLDAFNARMSEFRDISERMVAAGSFGG